jgi:hypothetical protein
VEGRSYVLSLFGEGSWRNHFEHLVELVDREGDIVDVLAAVEDFMGPSHVSDETAMAEGAHLAESGGRIVEDSNDPA